MNIVNTNSGVNHPASVAKGKITAAQVNGNCPAEVEDWCKRVAAHLESTQKYQKKIQNNDASIGKLLALIAEACDESGFEACREKFYPELGRSRTFELKAVAAGKKTIEQVKAETRERVARHRANRESVTSRVTDSNAAEVEVKGDDATSSAEERKRLYEAQDDARHVNALKIEPAPTASIGATIAGTNTAPVIPDDLSIPEILRRVLVPSGADHAEEHRGLDRRNGGERGHDHDPDANNVRDADEEQIMRDLVLEKYFAHASGTSIFERIPETRRAEVLAGFLDRLTVAGMLEAMSATFGQTLRARLPAPPRDESDKPRFKSMTMAKTVGSSGKITHALAPRGNSSRH